MSEIELALLADWPQAAAVVAGWYYRQWAQHEPGMTYGRVLDRVVAQGGRESAPLLVLALEDDRPVGAAGLKIREMEIYPNREFWLGGVYVEPGSRRRGIASRLVSEVMARARRAGIERLYLQTEDLSGGVYLRHGFSPIEEVVNKGHRVLVMSAFIEA